MQNQTDDRKSGFYISSQLRDSLDKLIIETREKRLEQESAKNESNSDEKDPKN